MKEQKKEDLKFAAEGIVVILFIAWVLYISYLIIPPVWDFMDVLFGRGFK